MKMLMHVHCLTLCRLSQKGRESLMSTLEDQKVEVAKEALKAMRGVFRRSHYFERPTCRQCSCCSLLLIRVAAHSGPALPLAVKGGHGAL